MSASREGEREQVELLVDLLIDERAIAWRQLQPQPDRAVQGRCGLEVVALVVLLLGTRTRT